AKTHHTCQCDKNPSTIKKLFVQPASAPNRHAPSPPATTAMGVNKSPKSDNAGRKSVNRTGAVTSARFARGPSFSCPSNHPFPIRICQTLSAADVESDRFSRSVHLSASRSGGETTRVSHEAERFLRTGQPSLGRCHRWPVLRRLACPK